MVKVLFFADLREKLGVAEHTVSIDESIPLESLKKMVGDSIPAAKEIFSRSDVLCAINQEMRNTDLLIKDGDEVAFFPPVTGG